MRNVPSIKHDMPFRRNQHQMLTLILRYKQQTALCIYADPFNDAQSSAPDATDPPRQAQIIASNNPQRPGEHCQNRTKAGHSACELHQFHSLCAPLRHMGDFK